MTSFLKGHGDSKVVNPLRGILGAAQFARCFTGPELIYRYQTFGPCQPTNGFYAPGAAIDTSAKGNQRDHDSWHPGRAFL